MQFNTEATITVAGVIKDFKIDRTKEKPMASFQLGVKRFRGKGKPDQWINYNVKMFGAEVDRLEGFKFGDGAIGMVTAPHDQRTVNGKEGKDARTYNNLTCNKVALLQDAPAAGGAAVGTESPIEDDDLPF